MARRDETLVIDLNSLTTQEMIDANALAASCGVDLSADLADPTIPALGALVYVVMRRTAPRVTFPRCLRIAARTWEATHGA
jgi:hypothetical protein